MRTGPLHSIRQSSGWQALTHMENIVVQWILQRTAGTITEEEDQNKLDNYSNQTRTAKIWPNADAKVDYVGYWTAGMFPHLGSPRSRTFQNYPTPLSKTHRKSTTLGPYDVPFSIPGYWGSLDTEYGFSHLSLLPPKSGRNRKFGINDHTHFSLTLDLCHPDLLCTYIKSKKVKTEKKK